MISGGMDSFAMAMELLTNPRYSKYQIHWHHIHLVNIHDRNTKESESWNKFQKWVRTNYPHRKMWFTEQLVDMRFMGDLRMEDYSIYTYMGGVICRQGLFGMYREMALGFTKDDDMPNRLKSAYVVRGTAIFKRLLKKDVGVSYPISHLNKKQLYLKLPITLRNTFWSCRTPKDGLACGVCKTCKTLKAYGICHP